MKLFNLAEELNQAAIGGDGEAARNFIKNHTTEEIYAFFQSSKQLYKAIKKIAHEDGPADFEKLVDKFKNDEEAMIAIVKGFKADEKDYAWNDAGKDNWSPIHHPELEAKRTTLFRLIPKAGKKNDPSPY